MGISGEYPGTITMLCGKCNILVVLTAKFHGNSESDVGKSSSSHSTVSLTEKPKPPISAQILHSIRWKVTAPQSGK